MKIRSAFCSLLILVLASCAGTPRPQGLSPTKSFSQVLAAFFTQVQMSDKQVNGVTGEGRPVLAVAGDAADPVLAAAVRFALDSKLIRDSTFILPVTPQGQVGAKQVVCPTEMVEKCQSVPVNTPVRVYLVDIPGAEGLLQASRISFED